VSSVYSWCYTCHRFDYNTPKATQQITGAFFGTRPSSNTHVDHSIPSQYPPDLRLRHRVNDLACMYRLLAQQPLSHYSATFLAPAPCSSRSQQKRHENSVPLPLHTTSLTTGGSSYASSLSCSEELALSDPCGVKILQPLKSTWCTPYPSFSLCLLLKLILVQFICLLDSFLNNVN
jgi:hypothetical protein